MKRKPATIKREINRLRKQIKKTDDVVLGKVSYAMESAEDTYGWEAPNADARSIADILRKQLEEKKTVLIRNTTAVLAPSGISALLCPENKSFSEMSPHQLMLLAAAQATEWAKKADECAEYNKTWRHLFDILGKRETRKIGN